MKLKYKHDKIVNYVIYILPQFFKNVLGKHEYISGNEHLTVSFLLPSAHLSNNHRLSNEVKTWQQRMLKREVHKEVTCENSPKSPKVTGTASKKRQLMTSQCEEQNLQDPMPKELPKSWFFDSRSKSLPAPRSGRYFDNSGLGLRPGG